MIHYDDLIKAEKMGYFSDYETLLFARAKGKIKSVIGVLPLTFTAKGGNAADWTIYGNDENGTENLFDKDSVIQNYFMSMNGAVSSTAGAYSDYIQVQPNASYYITRGIKLSTFYTACAYDSGKTFISYCNLNNTDGAITTPSNCAYVIINVLKTDLDAVMFTAGSIAPDHYIPYQQGVGEKMENLLDAQAYELLITVTGENLFDSSTMIDTTITNKYLKNDGTMGDASPWGITTYIPITADRVRLDNITGGAASICCYDINKNFIRGQQYYQQNPVLLNTSDAAFVRFSLTPDTESNAALFGLNDYTFYIGDTPLTEGETVSKTSTGVDIELFEGENVVSTTLYNKPEMKIEYD